MSKGLGLALGALVLAAPTDSVAQKPVEMRPEYVESVGPKMRTTEQIIADIHRLAKQRNEKTENTCRAALATVRGITGCEVLKTLEEARNPNAQSDLACEAANSSDAKYRGWDILAANMVACADLSEAKQANCVQFSAITPDGVTINRGNPNDLSGADTYRPAGVDPSGKAQVCVKEARFGRCITDDLQTWPDKGVVGMQGVLDHCSGAILKRLAQLDALRGIQGSIVHFETAVSPDQEDTIRTLLDMLNEGKQ